MKLFSSTWHLAARFFTSLSSAPPSTEDQEWVEERLSAAELALWSRQSNPDRRHSTIVARRFVDLRGSATDAEVAGALLHDVGKLECGLGTFRRVAWTLVGSHGPGFTAYHDHEDVGARMAADAGADPATVELIAGGGPAFSDLDECDRA
ncbi:MAG: hypothetical protein DRJ50_07910 [Actinobacteria bacterium]|nr:MAG: hypothetical protein DRJ50_07910 [Actinomycetota bacterium]